MNKAAIDLSSDLEHWRLALKQQKQELAQAYQAQPSPTKFFRQNTQFHDGLMLAIWQQFMSSSDACLIAVGGYGRKELYPYSDIDILILLPENQSEQFNQSLEAMISACWDIGLAIGQSVRTVNECVHEAGKDISVMTNLLEARYLSGRRTLFSALNKRLAESLNPQRFYAAKIEEQTLRHKRYNDSAYNLEPNIKESPGGLRDLHMLLWQARGLGIGSQWKALVSRRLISAREATQIRQHERLLQDLRIRLHFLARRREDRLIFDLQNELSASLGFQNTHRQRASEKLMRAFYRSAKFIHLMNGLILKLMDAIAFPHTPKIKSINPRFDNQDGMLHSHQDDIFAKHPEAIFEAFLIRQTHSEIQGFSPQLIRLLYQAKQYINQEFRRNPVQQKMFLAILQQSVGVHTALQEMNHLGLLGAYIPAFGRIVGQMQHDLFHVYTVDEHILRVVSNLHRFSLPEYSHEFPLCSELLKQFDAPYLMYLAALFHDIAKGRGGDHSALGERDAYRFAQQHGLNKEDTALVAWLVKAHLIMSSTAQKSDLSDPDIIKQFADKVLVERRLVALYLLTVADIRGTSPKVWNTWKAKLLETLFLHARHLLKGDQYNQQTEVLARQKDAAEKLGYYGIDPKSFQPHWQLFGESYFLRYNSPDIIWHTRLLLAHLHVKQPIVRARLSPYGDGIQVMIYLPDRDNLFAQICQCFDSLGFNILEARIHTTQHDYALDTFLIMEQEDRSINYRDLLSYIEYQVSENLSLNQAPQQPIAGRLSRQVKHMPIAADIQINQASQSPNIALDIIASDRPGLLSTIAFVLYQHHFKILNAKINTLGYRAEDSFLIAPESQQISTTVDYGELKQALLGQIGTH
jgi:[protein-PII] uridylyltransferase